MQRPRHAPTHHAPTRHATETWAAASGMHARVVGAVIMRDLQTRFGAGYFGFLLGLIMPLGHLAITIGISTALGRSTPLGTTGPIFLMTGVLPFVLWLYVHRQLMMTLLQNRPLLHFPGVDIFDLFLSRVIIEIVSCTLISSAFIYSLHLIGYKIEVNDIPKFLIGLISAWLLGVTTGIIFSALGTFMHFAIIVGNIMGPLLWVTSGIFFIPDDLPNKLSDLVYINPLAHIVDAVRLGYYSEYASSFYSSSFLYSSILMLLLIASLLVSACRRTL